LKGKRYESKGISEKDLRALQGGQAETEGIRHLFEPQAQATAGVGNGFRLIIFGLRMKASSRAKG
jgi:hypothetical protein